MIPTQELIQDYYKKYNTIVFSDELPNILLTINHTTSVLGLFVEDETALEIRISDFYDYPEQVLLSILIHEMCHLWCYVKGYHETHGKHWKAIAKVVKEKTGIVIERLVDIDGASPNPIYGEKFIKIKTKEMRSKIQKQLKVLRSTNEFPKENYWLYISKENKDEFQIEATENKKEGFVGYFVEDDERLLKIIDLIIRHK